MRSPLFPPACDSWRQIPAARLRAAGAEDIELAWQAERFDLSDADIAEDAERLASDIRQLSELWLSQGIDQTTAAQTLRNLASRHAVEFPTKALFSQQLNRMRDSAWWRRSLRKRRRSVEHHAIRSGHVHRLASSYVSPQALERHDLARRRLDAWLTSHDLLNLETGELIPLDEAVGNSLANPANRRMAMMARIKGIESNARKAGQEALFLTITAPSRMHAMHQAGVANEKYSGASPREVQAYLNGVWRRAMRRLQHGGLGVSGMRTVEPHHDGCPHWHVLMFVAPAQADAILAILRACALADSPQERGAALHRFRVERIDPAKGSALGYIAKYVSKSIDGEAVDTDIETGEGGATASRRIVAWARLWGIRQFQFFGVPAITPARELYRVKDGSTFADAGLRVAHQACQANDHAAYLTACAAYGLTFGVMYVDRPSSRYPDELSRAITGLRASAAAFAVPVELTTRTERWCIQPRQAQAAGAGLALPWTRFNNCAVPLNFRTGESSNRDRQVASEPVILPPHNPSSSALRAGQQAPSSMRQEQVAKSW